MRQCPEEQSEATKLIAAGCLVDCNYYVNYERVMFWGHNDFEWHILCTMALCGISGIYSRLLLAVLNRHVCLLVVIVTVKVDEKIAK